MYIISGLCKSEIEDIRVWRNAQMSILRQDKKITKEEQEAWFKAYTDACATYRPINYLWGMWDKPVDGDKVLIAYLGLVHIDWNTLSAETSFLSPGSRHNKSIYRKDFTYALKWMFEMARRPQFGLKELTSVTYTDTFFPSRPEDTHLDVLNEVFDSWKHSTENGQDVIIHRSVL